MTEEAAEGGPKVRAAVWLDRVTDPTPGPAHRPPWRPGIGAATSVGSLLASRVAAGAATMLVLVGAARLMTIEAVGALGLAMSVGLLFAAITEGGVWMVLVRDLAREPENAGRFVGSLFGLRLALAPPFAVVLLVVCLALYGSPMIPLILLGAAAAYVQTLSASIRGLLIALDRAGQAGALQTAEALIWAGALVTVAALTRSATAMLFTSSIVYLAMLVVGLARLRSVTPLRDIRHGLLEGRLLLGRSRSYAVFTIATVALSQVEITVASILQPLAAVAILQVGLRLLYVTDYLHDSVGQWAYPRLSQPNLAPAEFAQLVDRLYRGLALLGMPIALGLFVVGARLVPVLFGASYEAAVPIVQLLAIAVPSRYVAQGFGTMLSALGRQGDRSATVLAVLLLAVALQMVITASFGVVAVPVGTCITWLALATAYWWVARGLGGPVPVETVTAIATSTLLVVVAVLLPAYLEVSAVTAAVAGACAILAGRRWSHHSTAQDSRGLGR